MADESRGNPSLFGRKLDTLFPDFSRKPNNQGIPQFCYNCW